MQWNERNLDFKAGPFVMGIINCTPDSFYTGSRRETREAALEAAFSMIAGGVDIIDVGGESSRPGSRPVSGEEELARVIPVIEGIRRESDIFISIDTYKTPVAAAALEAGADMVNDIYALRGNPDLARLVARWDVPIILMHMQGTPQTMQQSPSYTDTIKEICRSLEAACEFALQSGIKQDRIILDPGIGFGKRLEDNLRILKELQAFRELGHPLLVGLSRKSFLGTVTGKGVEHRLTATIAAHTIALMHGADILRVHDWEEALDTVRIMKAISRA